MDEYEEAYNLWREYMSKPNNPIDWLNNYKTESHNMNTTCFECPSCNRRTEIPMRSSMDCKYDGQEIPEYEKKEYNLQDILWVNDELAKENIRLRKDIQKLQAMVYGR